MTSQLKLKESHISLPPPLPFTRRKLFCAKIQNSEQRTESLYKVTFFWGFFKSICAEAQHQVRVLSYTLFTYQQWVFPDSAAPSPLLCSYMDLWGWGAGNEKSFGDQISYVSRSLLLCSHRISSSCSWSTWKLFPCTQNAYGTLLACMFPLHLWYLFQIL